MGNTEQNTMRIKNTIRAVNRTIKKYIQYNTNTIQTQYTIRAVNRQKEIQHNTHLTHLKHGDLSS